MKRFIIHLRCGPQYQVAKANPKIERGAHARSSASESGGLGLESPSDIWPTDKFFSSESDILNTVPSK